MLGHNSRFQGNQQWGLIMSLSNINTMHLAYFWFTFDRHNLGHRYQQIQGLQIKIMAYPSFTKIYQCQATVRLLWLSINLIEDTLLSSLTGTADRFEYT